MGFTETSATKQQHRMELHLDHAPILIFFADIGAEHVSGARASMECKWADFGQNTEQLFH